MVLGGGEGVGGWRRSFFIRPVAFSLPENVLVCSAFALRPFSTFKPLTKMPHFSDSICKKSVLSSQTEMPDWSACPPFSGFNPVLCLERVLKR